MVFISTWFSVQNILQDLNISVQLQDLAAALTEHLKMTHCEATTVFEMLDQTGDREVHYTGWFFHAIT